MKLKSNLITFIILVLCCSYGYAQNIWTQISVQSNPTSTDEIKYSDVYFKNSTTGWACGINGLVAAGIFQTTDGGYNWTLIKATSMFDSFSDFVYIDDNTMWAAGSKGMGKQCLLYKTTDGGATWSTQTFPVNNAISGLYFSDANNGWAFVNISYVGKIYKTTDGGANWTEVFNGTTTDGWTIQSIYSYYFVNTNTIWAAGQSGHTIYSTDGGANWYYKDISFNAHVNSIYFIDANSGWLVGSSDILRTTDGGATWQKNELNIASFVFYSVCFLDANTGWACGGLGGLDNGAIYSTTDGGVTMIKDSVVSNCAPLKSLYFSDSNNGWAVGECGTVNKYGITTLVENKQNDSPINFELKQNYPNPFNPVTRILYSLSSEQYITLKVYNAEGKEVASLVDSRKKPGNHEVQFDGRDLSTGIYFYQLKTENGISQVRKMTFIK